MYRQEYPRPQFVREDWLNLNGSWGFAFDDRAVGEAEQWYGNGHELDRTIEVPFVFQSPRSGVDCQDFHDVVWYKRAVEVPGEWRGRRVILHFGAVDYRARVYVNGRFVGGHEGGQTGFSFDITDQLTWVEETIAVRAEDPSTDELIARGKQSWERESRLVWYTRSTGIWQTVWMEPVAPSHIGQVRFTPDVDNGRVGIEYEIETCPGVDQGAEDERGGGLPASDRIGSAGEQTEIPAAGLSLQIDISFAGEPVVCDTLRISEPAGFRSIGLFDHVMDHSFHGWGKCWSPETPNLFDVALTLRENGEVVDRAGSYFGMRKIHTENGLVYLNNQPYYQKLVLDQGYWPEGLLTAPSDEAFQRDIRLSKQMGFNGCRKHQKVEDPRFLYWADKLGYLVWGECASAPSFGTRAVDMAMREWPEIVARDYNHPCVVTWVPLNESWGVIGIVANSEQQHYSLALYHLIHALDGTRPVISNDGWEHTCSDICTIHDYRHGNKNQPARFETFQRGLSSLEQILAPRPYARPVYARGFAYGGQPVIISEFGGICYNVDAAGGWGYSSADSPQDFVEEYRRLVGVIDSSTTIVGYCYTQLTDVEQEANGLLTYHRQPKCDPDRIKEINDAVDRAM